MEKYLTKKPCSAKIIKKTFLISQPDMQSQIVILKINQLLKVSKVWDESDDLYGVIETATEKVWFLLKNAVVFEGLVPYVEIKDDEFHPDFFSVFEEYCDPKLTKLPDPKIYDAIKDAEATVQTMMENNVISVPLNVYQFTALVSFVADHGEQSLRRSTLLKYLNKEQYAKAAQEFGRWKRENGFNVKRKFHLRVEERKFFERGIDK